MQNKDNGDGPSGLLTYFERISEKRNHLFRPAVVLAEVIALKERSCYGTRGITNRTKSNKISIQGEEGGLATGGLRP